MAPEDPYPLPCPRVTPSSQEWAKHSRLLLTNRTQRKHWDTGFNTGLRRQ